MKLLLGWICSVWESTKKSSSAMTSEALSFYIWKGETLRYFLCATFLLLTIFFDKTTTNFSSFPALVIACSLAYTVQICNKLICAVLGPDFLKCWLELTTKNICFIQNFGFPTPPPPLYAEWYDVVDAVFVRRHRRSTFSIFLASV